MRKRLNQRLSDVPETLLIPVWARAVETKSANPIVRDTKSVEMVELIDYDFSKFDKAWKSQLGIAIRTMLLDGATTAFVQKARNAVIINLGAGLDARFSRVDNGQIRWYDIDLAEPIRIKKKFFVETDRYKMIDKSVFEFSWIKDVSISNEPVLIIAEGFLMYFEAGEIKNLFNKLVTAFPEAEMLFEMMTPFVAKNTKYHDSVGKTSAVFKWGINRGKDVEAFNKKIKFVEEWNYFDFCKKRWRWLGVLALLSVFKNRFQNRIVHLTYGYR